MTGGELFDRIIEIGHFDEETAKMLFVQMVEAVQYLHKRGIAHRDLKVRNLDKIFYNCLLYCKSIRRGDNQQSSI